MDGDAREPLGPKAMVGYSAAHLDYAKPRLLRPGPPPARPAEPRNPPRPAPADDDHAPGKDGGDAHAKPPMPRWRKILYWAIGAAVLLAIIVAGVLYWMWSRQFQNTDDAFIDGHISQVSSQVAGRVIELDIEDYQDVKAGAVIVKLDPRDEQVKLDQARAQRSQAAAQFDQAQAQLLTQQATLDQAEANVRVSQADLQQAQADLARYRAIDPKAVTRQTVENAGANTKAAQARVEANQQAVEAARANIAVQKASIEAAQANLKAADVAVANAELQLSYTTVRAPRDGKIAKRTVEVGNYINPGQALVAVVGTDRWVTANFKETQLAGMKPGQRVRISVDGCPGHDFAGRVDSFQPGSGSIFSALPAENATGNYVKVVQRVPVKITFDDPNPTDCRLSPGMSVEPRVTVK